MRVMNCKIFRHSFRSLFIFGKLEEGMSLSQATALAREMGYTEPDPRDDLPVWMWRGNC